MSLLLALECMLGQDLDVNKDGHLVLIQDWISNSFSVIPDQHGAVANNLHADTNRNIGTTIDAASEGECAHPMLIEPFGETAAVMSSSPMPQMERMGIKVNLLDDFEAEAANSG
jgi:hypothetical protein